MVNMIDGKPWFPFWERQDNVVLNQANPVSGTQYMVLNAVPMVKVKAMNASVTWTVQPTPLEVWTTEDGVQEEHFIANPDSTEVYHAKDVMSALQTDFTLCLNDADNTRGTQLNVMGKEVTVEAETTGGTVQNLSCVVTYWRYR